MSQFELPPPNSTANSANNKTENNFNIDNTEYIENKNIQRHLEFLKFDIRKNNLLNRYHANLTIRKNLIQSAYNLLTNKKSSTISRDFLMDDVETTKNALVWFKTKLLKEISKTNSQSQELIDLQNKLKIVEEALDKLKKILRQKEEALENTNEQLSKNKKEYEQLLKEKDNVISEKQTEMKENTAKNQQIVAETKNEYQNNLISAKKKTEMTAKEHKKRLSELSKDFKIVLNKMEEKLVVARKESENLKLLINEKEIHRTNFEREEKMMQHKINELGEKILQLKKKKTACKGKIEVLGKRVYEAKERCNKLEFELKTEQNCHEMSKKETKTNLKQLNELHKRAESLQNELVREKSAGNANSIELDELRKSLSKTRENKRSASSSQRETEKELQNLKIENVKYRQKVVELEKMTAKLENDNFEIRTFYNQSQNSRTPNNKKSRRNATNKNITLEIFLKTQIEEMNKKMAKKDEEKMQLLKTIEEKESKSNELDIKHQKTNLEMKNKLLELNHRIKSMQSKNSIKTSSLSQNTKMRDHLESQIAILEEKLSKSLTETRENESQVGYLENEKKELARRLKEKEKRFEQLDKELKSSGRINNKKSTEKLQKALVELEKNKQTVIALKEENNSKNRKISQLNEDIKRLKEQSADKLAREESRRKRGNNLFEVYSANSKKAKNIIDEELLKLKRSLDENIYGNKSANPPKAIINTGKTGTKKSIKQTKRNTKVTRKTSTKEPIQNKSGAKIGNKKETMNKRDIKKKATTSVKPKKLELKSGSSESGDDSSDDSFEKTKRLTLRERIEMSKNWNF